MELLLQRETSKRHCTHGLLYIDGDYECHTLEDEVRELPNMPVEQWKIKGKTAIPQGRYRVDITASARFHKDLPILENVPGFSGIRIHAGNTAADTEGCILVGHARSEDAIFESRNALRQLQGKIQAALDDGLDVFMEVRNP